MREVLAINMGTVTSLLSRLGWIPLSEFSFRAMAHVLVVLPNFVTVEYLYMVQFGIVTCLG